MNKTKTIIMYSVVGIVPPLRKIENNDGIILQIENPEWSIVDIQYGRNEKGELERFILTIDKNQTEDRKEEENENC